MALHKFTLNLNLATNLPTQCWLTGCSDALLELLWFAAVLSMCSPLSCCSPMPFVLIGQTQRSTRMLTFWDCVVDDDVTIRESRGLMYSICGHLTSDMWCLMSLWSCWWMTTMLEEVVMERTIDLLLHQLSHVTTLITDRCVRPCNKPKTPLYCQISKTVRTRD